MWAITIQMQGKPIVVKVDTGAEVTVISDSTCTWKTLNFAKPLEETGVSLYGPDRTHLKILSKINLNLSHHERCCIQDVYVIKDLKSNLLGFASNQVTRIIVECMLH